MDCGLRKRLEGEEDCLDSIQLLFQKGIGGGEVNKNLEKWCDPVNCQHTDTSTDIGTDDKTQLNGIQQEILLATNCSYQPKVKSTEQRTLQILAQNREAAIKSRLKKKDYVQLLENSRIKLAQLDEDYSCAIALSFA